MVIEGGILVGGLLTVLVSVLAFVYQLMTKLDSKVDRFEDKLDRIETRLIAVETR